MTFLERCKKAGEEAAKSHFGALTSTDKPPPTWAHGRKVKIPSMTQAACKHECFRCAGKRPCTHAM